jgi:predicted Ser/Thr protein kinase
MDKKCPQCGATLPSGALEGMCPACLLKQGAAGDTGAPGRPGAFVPPTTEELAALFPQLEILGLIGRGGMGAVYKARQRTLDRVVALKVLPPQAAAAPGFSERFNREARALARLNHPNIVVLHEFGQAGGLPFFIMEYVEGVNLRQLEQSGRLPAAQALAIIPQICEALQFAHDAGVVHRDVKPENILIDKAGRVKIADFGIAKLAGADAADVGVTATGQAVGTPHYMAPEQMVSPESVDHRADIYALGVVFYEMLTGELPLGKFAPPSRRVQVDVRLDDVVLRALEREPQHRYQKVSEVRTRLDTISGGAGGPAGGPATPVRPSLDARTLEQDVIARNTVVGIRACYRRSWVLLWADLLPTVAITILILLAAAGVNILAGPLVGGLWLYFIHRIRGIAPNTRSTVDGVKSAIFPLVLGGLVAGPVSVLLILVLFFGLVGGIFGHDGRMHVFGFLCFLTLPVAIGCAVSWMFTVAAIADKGLGFWAALRLSARTVLRRPFKFGLLFASALALNFVGFLMCGVGLLITLPLTLGAMAYAYEDVIGSVGTKPEAPRTGPSGTVVTVAVAEGRGGRFSWLFVAGAVVVLFATLLFLVLTIPRFLFSRPDRVMLVQDSVLPPPVSNDQMVTVTNYAFGRVIERTLHDPDDDVRNACLDLKTGRISDLAVPWPDPTSPDDAFTNAWDGLAGALGDQGPDLVGHAGRRALEFFPGPVVSVPVDAMDTMTAAVAWNSQLLAAAAEGLSHGEAHRATVVVSNLPAAYLFKTRAGQPGLMLVTAFTEAPHGVRFRYKLVEESVRDEPRAAQGEVGDAGADDEAAKLEAALRIGNLSERDQLLSGIVLRAATAGRAALALQAVGSINNLSDRSTAAAAAARALVQKGMRRKAMEMAERIPNLTLRNQLNSELAQ